MIELLQASPTTWAIVATLLGLALGSFLNVVIHRVPIMMENELRSDCESLQEEPENLEEPATFNLVVPASRCPHCEHKISALENIPIASYLLLGGKCKACKTPISARYPAIEFVTAIISLAVASKFGFSSACLLALVLSWGLIALAAIDFDTQLLPDSITLLLLWLGISANYFGLFVPLEAAVLGAMFGYLALWAVFWMFKLATGKEGMGYGDFKLLAAIGAWLGWEMLPLVILLSSVVGAVVGISMMALLGHDRSKEIPFGPYLAAAGWIALMWGDEIMQRYLHGGSAL